jgi:hypothetical protein
MLNYAVYENFETKNLKSFLNDNDGQNNLADLDTSIATNLFKHSSMDNDESHKNNDNYERNNYQRNNDYNNQQKSLDDLTLKHAKLDGTLEKLNHIIHLLERQQDEKTETVMEELILYLFLGFFIIYIVDSFFRAGKYSR